MSAGMIAAHLAHNGKSIIGTSHGRPDVVWNVDGMVKLGKTASTPCARRAERATSDPNMTPMVGPKLDRLLRIVLLKNTEFRRPFNKVAVPKVVEATVIVNNALVNVDIGEVNVLLTSDTASITKIAEINTEKISSVNLVRYLTKLDADVIDDRNKIPAVQKPVQEYNGRNGKFIAFAS